MYSVIQNLLVHIFFDDDYKVLLRRFRHTNTSKHKYTYNFNFITFFKHTYLLYGDVCKQFFSSFSMLEKIF